MRFRFPAVLALCLGLAACATADPKWFARTDADLGTDLAACKAEAGQVNMRSMADYSGQYGVAAATAAKLDEESIAGGGEKRVFEIVRDSCMIQKGWKKAG